MKWCKCKVLADKTSRLQFNWSAEAVCLKSNEISEYMQEPAYIVYILLNSAESCVEETFRTRFISADPLLKSTLSSYFLRCLLGSVGYFFNLGLNRQTKQTCLTKKQQPADWQQHCRRYQMKTTSAIVHTPLPNSEKDLEGQPDPTWFSYLRLPGLRSYRSTNTFVSHSLVF